MDIDNPNILITTELAATEPEHGPRIIATAHTGERVTLPIPTESDGHLFYRHAEAADALLHHMGHNPSDYDNLFISLRNGAAYAFTARPADANDDDD